MSRSIAVVFILLILFCARAEARLQPIEIEVAVIDMVGTENISGPDGYALEKAHGIARPSWNFNCVDRAEIAMRLAQENGYRAEYAHSRGRAPGIGHRYIVVWDDDGVMTPLLDIDFVEQDRAQVREWVKQMRRRGMH